jgi:uncharacterized protein (TIGR03435 family)
MVAWHLQDFEVVGGPGWIDSARYNVEAKAGGATTAEEARLMLRSLLKDRFHLALRSETRELPTYSLELAKPNGTLGFGLVQTANGSCVPVSDFGAPPVAPLNSAQPLCGLSSHLRRQENGTALMQLVARGLALDALARGLGTALGRHVENNTHIDGVYSFTLEYAPERLPVGPAEAQPDTTGPALVTVLQEQLGLKLRSGKGPCQVWAIDHAEKPDPN